MLIRVFKFPVKQMNCMKKLFCLLLFIYSSNSFSQELQRIETGLNTSFRGLSVVDFNTAWISGNNGWIGVSNSGGIYWDFMQIPGFEKLDFRSIYAFDNQRAIVANAGSPAYIFLTTDGGNTWKNVYRDERKEIFINGITFFDEHEGVIFGDPINHRMFLLRTINQGQDWKEFPEEQKPVMVDGEAAFAASGTTIRSYNEHRLIIASGGAVSRLFISEDKGLSWNVTLTPILQGKSSTGVFSFDFLDDANGIIVGGDYTRDTLKTDHVFITRNKGAIWQKPQSATGGYRSAVEYIDDQTIIATGPSGTDISEDGGINWKPLVTEGFNVIRMSRSGNLVVLGGSNGRISFFRHKQ
jgi:photosystem II stability/assembly factor-like uncharacterized protein